MCAVMLQSYEMLYGLRAKAGAPFLSFLSFLCSSQCATLAALAATLIAGRRDALTHVYTGRMGSRSVEKVGRTQLQQATQAV